MMGRSFRSLLAAALFAAPVLSQPTVLGDRGYADSVRVLLLTNGSAGGENFCSPFTRPVFEKTEAFVRKALSPLPAANVQVRRSQNFPWSEVVKLWPGKLPHVIVHINAGWGDPSPHIAAVLNAAADSAIGVVSIGDDAGDFAQRIFKLTKVENEPLPMKDGRILEEPEDSLWIQLKRESDTLPSNGVIRNTVDSLRRRSLLFKPFRMNGQGDIRCQADADDYSEVDAADKEMLTFLGFQRGYDHSAGKELHPPEDLQVIVTFQDRQRRGVALSFQPQYLVDSAAAWQIVYDAILYASFAHLPPKPVIPIRVNPVPVDPAPDKPLPMNPVTAAYMKDIDGDGAGDHVFIAFARPVDTLPATLDTVYWNQVGPAFARRQPRIAHLPGTDRKTVMADFSGSGFGAGLTSIPPGARPYAVLPADPVFAAQRPALADSMGPVLIAGTLQPFSLADGTTSNLPDTLDLVLSEPLRAAGSWSVLARFSPSRDGACSDYASSTLITAEPLRVRGTLLRIPAALENGPARGDCVYLNLDGGYTDTLGNPPPRHGVRLEGPDPSGRIVRAKGHPPVAGCAACDPVGAGPLTWVPPVGYVAGAPFREFPVPAPGSRPAGTDPGVAGPLPPGVPAVQVVSTGRYIAHATLFDIYGNVVRRLSQSFGYRGEMENRARYRNRAWTSYLAWDGLDEAGREAGNGMYIWKIRFVLEDGSTQASTLRTGYLRGRR